MSLQESKPPQGENYKGAYIYILCIYIYIYMSPIPFGLMRLGILSSIINTQANFCYTLLIFIHVNRQVLHMTRIAYIIYYMPCTLIPLMIYHVLYIRCYILCIT